MVCGSATAGCQIDTLPTRWLVWQFPTLAATPVPGPCRRLPRQTGRWCLESTPILGLDLPEFRLDDPIDARGFLVQTTQLAETLHPRFILACSGAQLLRERFGYQRPQWNTLFRRGQLSPSKKRIRNFKRGFHPVSIVPYLWESSPRRPA